MDIDLLAKMLKELILDRDEVSLPGVGSFVAELIPSSFSDRGYTINPPYRRLYFRQRENVADTSLVDLYASSNGIGQEDALNIIVDFLSGMKEVLHQKKMIVFPGLGRLRATRENNIFFVADEDLDIYPAGFGLEPISLKTHKETSEEVSAAVASLKSLITEPETESMGVNPEKESAEAKPKSAEVEPEAESVSESAYAETEPESAETEAIEVLAIEENPQEETILQEKKAEERTQTKKTGAGKAFAKAAIVILFIGAAALAAFMILARLQPELIDQILYTPEELEIVRQM